MGRILIRQANGLWAIWSTIVDGFIVSDYTVTQITDFMVDEARESIQEKVMGDVEKILSGKEKLTYQECLDILKEKEMDKTLKPSDFAKIEPFDSVFHNSEHETVASNIMVILKRTGDIWRELSWEEYLQERIKDGGGNTSNRKGLSEEIMFPKVQPYTVNAEEAKNFCPTWAKVK